MNKIAKYVFITFLLFNLLCCQKTRDGRWQGNIATENGVIVIKNPDKPIYEREIVTFEDELIIGTKEKDDEGSFSDISCFTVDYEGNIYIVDGRRLVIIIYNKEGKYIQTIGRKGQGPGEFSFPPSNIQFTPEKEIMVVTNSILFYKPDGQFLRELRHPTVILSLSTFIDAHKNLYILKSEFDNKQNLYKLRPPYKDPDIIAIREEIGRATPFPMIRYDIVKEDMLIWGISSDYKFYITDDKGKIIKIIEKERKPLMLTTDWKERYLNTLPKEFPKERHEFSRYFPAFDYFFADDEGRLFVKTFEKIPGTDKYFFDIFDPEGRYLTRAALKVGREISLKQGNFIIKNNKLYTVYYDEEDYPILKRMKIIWQTDLNSK